MDSKRKAVQNFCKANGGHAYEIVIHDVTESTPWGSYITTPRLNRCKYCGHEIRGIIEEVK